MTIVITTPLFTQEVPEKAAAKGHVVFTSSSVVQADIALLCFTASISSALLYEKLHAGGTTLIVQLEKTKTKIDVLARFDEDKLDLQWEIKTGDAAQLDAVQEKIRGKTFMLMHQEKETSKLNLTSANSSSANASSSTSSNLSNEPKIDSSTPRLVPTHADDPSTKEEQEQEDYQVKQLKRIP